MRILGQHKDLSNAMLAGVSQHLGNGSGYSSVFVGPRWSNPVANGDGREEAPCDGSGAGIIGDENGDGICAGWNR